MACGPGGCGTQRSMFADRLRATRSGRMSEGNYGGSSSGYRSTRYGGKPEGSFWSGTPEYNEQYPLYAPEQEQFFSQFLNRGSQGLMDLVGQLQRPLARPSVSPYTKEIQVEKFPQFNFEPIAEKARTEFQTRTVPSLAQMFTSFGGRGTEGAQRSSAYPAALSSAGSQLDEGLAALRAQYGLKEEALRQSREEMGLRYGLQQDAIRQAQEEMGLRYGLGYDQLSASRQGQIASILGALTQMGAQPRFGTVQHQAEPGFGQQLLGGIGSALGGLASGAASGLGLGSTLKLLGRL